MNVQEKDNFRYILLNVQEKDRGKGERLATVSNHNFIKVFPIRVFPIHQLLGEGGGIGDGGGGEAGGMRGGSTTDSI